MPALFGALTHVHGRKLKPERGLMTKKSLLALLPAFPRGRFYVHTHESALFTHTVCSAVLLLDDPDIVMMSQILMSWIL